MCLLWVKCLFGEEEYLFFRNSPLPQINTFSLEQKECVYYEKSAYYEWAQLLNSMPHNLHQMKRFDSKEQMFVADYTGHNILKYNDEEKRLEIFAHNSNMNQPNDIAIMGQVYTHINNLIVFQYCRKKTKNNRYFVKIIYHEKDNDIIFASDPNWAENTGQMWRKVFRIEKSECKILKRIE